MEIEILLRGESKVEMPIEYIIDEINKQPLNQRFAVLRRMLNEVILCDINNITIGQRAIIIDFLQKYYEIFTGSFNSPKRNTKKFFKFF